MDHKSAWGKVALSEVKCTLGDPFEPIFSELHVDTVGIASFFGVRACWLMADIMISIFAV